MADPHHREIIDALQALASSGVACHFMHGNRDFLIGPDFARAAGLRLLDDPTRITCHGRRLLLSHGDALCSDDTDYLTFRAQVRAPTWQRQFLQTPLAARKAQIAALRATSEREKSAKPDSIMDVNDEAVRVLLRAHDYPDIFIHGHTHRPALHRLDVDGRPVERWVLGDWYRQGSYLRLDHDGCRACPLAGAAP